MNRTHIHTTCFILALALASSASAQQNEARGGGKKIVKEGVAIEMSIDPVAPAKNGAGELIGGETATVRFRITNTNSGTPVTRLRPAAWMDYIEKYKPSERKECKEKIESFLQGSLAARPDLDLNSYYILALNKEPSISVIDPLISFGTSKLLTLVMLNNPGEDWVLSRDGRRLFVTMPMSNQVAVIDTGTWKVLINIESGLRPGRIVLQTDEKYAWVGDGDADAAQSFVSAIDTATHKVAARIPVGAGRHEIALTGDDRFAFVSNERDGTLSVIDVRQLSKVKEVKIGKRATSLAFSPLSKAIYVTDESSGEVVVVDSQTHAVVARVRLKPGLKAVRFAPGGRFGFVVNSKEGAAYIFDASSNRVLHAVEVGPGPDQISFTGNYAYVRSVGTEQVSMIALTGLDKGEHIQPTKFPGGQIAPDKASGAAGASVIVPTPEGISVLVANPADQTIYYYTEGMAAPMGSFQNYRREPRGVIVVDRSIRETSPGVYSATVRLPEGGRYDLAFLLDSPRVVHCFEATVKPNPAQAKRYPQAPLRVQYLVDDPKVRAGEKATLRFKLTDMETGAAKADLKDVNVLTFLAPGIWQQRQWATPIGKGVYEISFVPPETGVYYIFLQCPSLKIKLNQLPHMILDGRAQKAEAVAK